MNRDVLLALYDRQFRFGSSDAPYERQAVPEGAPVVVRHLPRDPRARWGWVIWSALDGSTADRVIAEQIEFFTGRGQNFEWKCFAHDRPADLAQRLLAHGLIEDELETVLALDLAESHLWQAAQPPVAELQGQGIEVRRLTDLADLHQVVEIEDAVWDTPHDWILDELGRELMLPGEPLQMYLASVEGLPAAAAWIRFHDDTEFASLFGGSTLPEHRGRGLYTALLAVRARAAHDRGYRFLTVDASEMSRPILEKHGFVPITTAKAYKHRLADTAE